MLQYLLAILEEYDSTGSDSFITHLIRTTQNQNALTICANDLQRLSFNPIKTEYNFKLPFYLAIQIHRYLEQGDLENAKKIYLQLAQNYYQFIPPYHFSREKVHAYQKAVDAMLTYATLHIAQAYMTKNSHFVALTILNKGVQTLRLSVDDKIKYVGELTLNLTRVILILKNSPIKKESLFLEVAYKAFQFLSFLHGRHEMAFRQPENKNYGVFYHQPAYGIYQQQRGLMQVSAELDKQIYLAQSCYEIAVFQRQIHEVLIELGVNSAFPLSKVGYHQRVLNWENVFRQLVETNRDTNKISAENSSLPAITIFEMAINLPEEAETSNKKTWSWQLIRGDKVAPAEEAMRLISTDDGNDKRREFRN